MPLCVPSLKSIRFLSWTLLSLKAVGKNQQNGEKYLRKKAVYY